MFELPITVLFNYPDEVYEYDSYTANMVRLMSTLLLKEVMYDLFATGFPPIETASYSIRETGLRLSDVFRGLVRWI